MKANNATELIEKYSKCPDCGSYAVGDSKGKIEIHEDVFMRSCKCGFSVVIKENNC